MGVAERERERERARAREVERTKEFQSMCNAWALYRRFWRLSGKLTDDVRVRGARLAFGSHPSITKWCCRCCKMKGSMVVEH